MKAILIDPYAAIIAENDGMTLADTSLMMREVEHDGTLASVYRLLSGETDDAPHNVSTIDAIHMPHGDAAYIDDNGLLTGGNWVWATPFLPSTVSGRALIVGTNDDGDDAEPQVTLADFKGALTLLGKTAGC